MTTKSLLEQGHFMSLFLPLPSAETLSYFLKNLGKKETLSVCVELFSGTALVTGTSSIMNQHEETLSVCPSNVYEERG